jgi:endonuclease G
LSVLATLLLSPPSRAASTACPDHFAAGTPPALTNPALARQTQELCYTGFALLHSAIVHSAVWSAEHLTAASVGAARAMVRENAFHVEPRLPPADRADLTDYITHGTWDRGHLSPSGDMADARAQQESFTLANIVPQQPDHNRGLWADLESAVRNLAQAEGDLYVVTGPIYAGDRLQRLNGRVGIPTHLYKAVYSPRRQAAAAYISPNTAAGTYEVVSLAQLTARTGIDSFPLLSSATKSVAMDLPGPAPRRQHTSTPTSPSSPSPAATAARLWHSLHGSHH